MSRAIGKTFKIKRSDVKTYDYTVPRKRGMRSNPSVTTIAAINGRGAYRRRHRRVQPSASARASMSGLSANRRVAKARRQLSAAQRNAFARKLGAKRSGKNVARSNRKPRRARSAGTSSHRRNEMYANARRRRRRRITKNRRRTASAAPKRRRRHRRHAVAAAPKRRRRRARRATAAPKRRRRRVARKAAPRRRRRRVAMAANPRRRRRRVARAAAPKRRRRRRVARKAAAPVRRRRRRVARAAAPKRRRRRTRRLAANRRRRHHRNAYVSNRRRSRRRKAHAKNRRRTHARRRHSANRRRRSHRRNSWFGHRKAHRRAALSGWSKRRRRSRKGRKGMHANRRRRLHRNPGVAAVLEVLKTGALITVGVAGQKLLTGLIRTQVLDRIFPPAAPVTAPAASGLGAMLDEFNPLIAGALGAAAGAWATHMLVKDRNTKVLIMGGFGAGFVHTALVFLLNKLNQPKIADMLSGDGTAARISAMYGLGAGASLQPHYAPISGFGEYFSEAGAASGLGAYGPNPDIMQAAAGYGAADTSYGYGNHISPSSDLDRELTIAEAAAGIGTVQPFEANAGTGEYFTGTGEYFTEGGMSGLGAIKSLPAADTWVPGMANAQLWAGVRSANEPQSAHMMLPAGVLETAGGAGIFG